MIEGSTDDGNRFHAWYDQLSQDERGEVDYVVKELKGDFATAYLCVSMKRLADGLGGRMHALENRSPFRVGLREIVTVVGAILAALGLQHSNVSLPK